MTAAPTPAGPALPGRRQATLVVLCFVQFMLVLDDTVVNVALSSIRSDLGFSTTDLTWVANAYFLAFGGLLLLFGRLGDLIGRRRVFLWGVSLFGAASLLCGLAQEPWQLVAGRFAQGAGAAMASPAALALITLIFPGRAERAKALGIWGAIAGLGGTTGVVISGALTGLASWRWIFLINLPVAVLALVLLPRLVGESRTDRPARPDVPGALLGTGAVVSLVYALLRTEKADWGEVSVLAPLLLGVALGALFLLVEARTADPLIPPAFLSVRIRLVSNAAGLIFAAVFFALSFLLMLHLQAVLGYGPLKAGLAFLPYGAGILTGVWCSSRLAVGLGLRWALVLAFLISAVGLLLLSGVSPSDGYATGVLPGMLVVGFGSGLGFPALAMAGVSGTDEENAGLGSAILNSVQQIGGAVGLAVLVSVATRRTEELTGSVGPSRAATQGFSLTLTVAAGLLVLGAALIAVLLARDSAARPEPTAREPAPKPVRR
ncbi:MULTISPECIES: MFS transporter [Streptomyces]|uniref:Permease of the major facilitator superfamily n=2 Tax=Streptomyces griseus TaxID=1911 RepID=B1VMC2_STRGG|nr:MFS transporter [Streptomyces griseus]BAG20232.1 putative permease of the major facilitator superfamily [Streptomyces griseus subsp. griseus NBRC 13350]SEE82055.1 drug resistance transporter, EmrB/QacA subfamily [Streptomyces griseus]SQA23047.1 major facilitator superfamily permease [Streptomyces griseus]